jgi:hypothetical protein
MLLPTVHLIALLAHFQSGPLEAARQACQMDASACFDLVQELRVQGLADEAYKTGIAAHAKVGATVAASNNTVWIIDEHIRRGRTEDAKRLARQAASTGSQLGLEALARVEERTGSEAEAARLYQAVDERYGTDYAAALEVRRLARSGANRAVLAKAIAGLGLHETIGFVVDPDRQGAVRREQLKRMGFQIGDRVVSVRGYEVKHWAQFWTALSLDDSPSIEMTVTSPSRGKVVTLHGELSRPLYGRLAK